MLDSDESLVELVITAPEPYGLALAYQMRCRTTLGVLTLLMAQAQRYVVIAAPFLQAGHGLSEGPLADALRAALRRGVNIAIVSTRQGLQTLNIADLRKDVRGRLRLFQHQANKEDDQNLGSHAKFCLVDGEHAYVGSANLTGPGLSKHFEMGLLVHGKVARQIAEFWDYAVEIGLFVSDK
ncbi:MAG TPA: phospholipase D family protein [Ktedonosporobacter sp.]|jgi:phosphatidylserine/phosphatidylglycerophosphate/cardiolipin synthase-like enzyme|nr:phospholipase D family protein [Ktedonosporobacter sp.]